MLDENGFTRPSLNEIIDDLTAKWQQYFGANANTSTHSVSGILIRVLAYFIDILYQIAELVYDNGFLSMATGTNLDRLADNAGLERNPAETAMVTLQFTGIPNYVVPAGTLFGTQDNLNFGLADDVTLDANGNGAGLAYAIEMGASYNVLANSVTLQTEPNENIFSVNNQQPANGGADIESDTSLANRIRSSNEMKPSSPVNGLISAILDVSGVVTVKIIENNSMDTDNYGNPPKSIHIYVQGGSQNEIALAIFNSVAAGIQTYGTLQVTEIDDAGLSHNVSFDFATQTQIFVQIQKISNLSYPVDGDEQIKQMIKNYLQSLTMGEIIRYSYLYKEIYDNVVGLDVIDVKIGTNASSLQAADIQLDVFAVGIISDNNITVEDMGA